jgi:hypothetical protein
MTDSFDSTIKIRKLSIKSFIIDKLKLILVNLSVLTMNNPFIVETYIGYPL